MEEELLDKKLEEFERRLIEYKIPERDWEDFRDVYSRTNVPVDAILCIMAYSNLTVDDIKDVVDGLESAVLQYKDENFLKDEDAWTKALNVYVKKGGMDLYRTRDILSGNHPMQHIRRTSSIPSISYSID
jgi:hypothetical protein